MEAIIKSLNPEACKRIDEVFGDCWRGEVSEFYEDGVEMYDVTVLLSEVTIETDEEDGVWICRGCDYMHRLEPRDFLEIIIR